MNANRTASSGFIDWTLIAAAVLAVTAVAGGIIAYISYEKRMAQTRSEIRTPPPPEIRTTYYEESASGGGAED